MGRKIIAALQVSVDDFIEVQCRVLYLRRLFNQMLKECLENEEYTEGFKTKGQQYSAESLFMALIFQQQKTISRLIESLRSKSCFYL